MRHLEQTNEHTDIKGEVPESERAATARRSDHLGVQYLAQGYFSSALKVSCHPHTFQFSVFHRGLN